MKWWHAVPHELDEASLALGATPVRRRSGVTIPYAWPGILSALVLSIGRVTRTKKATR